MYNSTVLTAIGRIIAVAGLATVLIAGCSRIPKMVGTYRGFRSYQVAPGEDPVVVQQAARVEIIVKGDKVYLSDGGLPAEGRIDYGDSSATFVPESFMGQSADQQNPALVKQFTVPLKPLPGGDWLYGGSVRLEKQPATTP